MARNDITENRLRSLAISYGEIAIALDEHELEEEHEAIRDAIDDLATAIEEAKEAVADSSVEEEDEEEE